MSFISARANIERANPFRPIHLMRSQRCQIHSQRLHIRWELSNSLHRIRVKHYAVLFRDVGNFGNWVYRSDFVIRIHETDERSLRRNRRRHIVRSYHSVCIHWQIRRLKPLRRQSVTGIQHGVMLSRACDNVIFPCLSGCNSPDSKVIRFCRATRKNNLFRGTAEQCCDLRARLLHCILRRYAKRMRAGGIPEMCR